MLPETLDDPTFWLTAGGGALRVGLGIVNGVFSVIFVVALTLYFVIGHISAMLCTTVALFTSPTAGPASSASRSHIRS